MFHRLCVLGCIAIALALFLVVGSGTSGAVERLRGPWHHPSGPETADHAGRGHSDDRSCVDPGTEPAAPIAGQASQSSITQTLSVVVPPIVRVQSIDERTVTVVTNAERAPAVGDEVYLRQADGSYAPAEAALVAQVMSAKWKPSTSWCSTTAEHVGRLAPGRHHPGR